MKTLIIATLLTLITFTSHAGYGNNISYCKENANDQPIKMEIKRFEDDANIAVVWMEDQLEMRYEFRDVLDSGAYVYVGKKDGKVTTHIAIRKGVYGEWVLTVLLLGETQLKCKEI